MITSTCSMEFTPGARSSSQLSHCLLQGHCYDPKIDIGAQQRRWNNCNMAKGHSTTPSNFYSESIRVSEHWIQRSAYHSAQTSKCIQNRSQAWKRSLNDEHLDTEIVTVLKLKQAKVWATNHYRKRLYIIFCYRLSGYEYFNLYSCVSICNGYVLGLVTCLPDVYILLGLRSTFTTWIENHPSRQRRPNHRPILYSGKLLQIYLYSTEKHSEVFKTV